MTERSTPPDSDAALVREYLDALRHQRRLAPGTLINYRHAIEQLLSLSSGMRLASLEGAPLRRFVAPLHARGLSGRTLAKMLPAGAACTVGSCGIPD